MIFSVVNQGFLETIAEPQVWFPVLVAFLGYFLQGWIRLIFRRKEESRRAVIYLTEVYEEIKNGVELFEFMYFHGGATQMCGTKPALMTTEVWRMGGFGASIPDDVFQRIINVAHRTKAIDVCGLRSHLKNYYVCICSQYKNIAEKQLTFDPRSYRNSLEGARMVKQLVFDCKRMMRENSTCNFWPW